jgi:hypothetical protein
MGIFDFLKRKSPEQVKPEEGKSSNEIIFTLTNINRSVLSNYEVGDYVNLWTQPDMNRVIIYAPGSVGGSGQLGIVPDKYFKTIQAHILGENNYGMSGPSMHNYDATIVNISALGCAIRIKLFTPEEHKKMIADIIDQEKKTIKADLEKHYKMTKPVLIQFNIAHIKIVNLEDLKLKVVNPENLKLKIFEKEYYIEHPSDYKLQLVDDTDKIVAETYSQKDKVFRVVKSFYNGQQMILMKIDYEGDHLNVLIGAE